MSDNGPTNQGTNVDGDGKDAAGIPGSTVVMSVPQLGNGFMDPVVAELRRLVDTLQVIGDAALGRVPSAHDGTGTQLSPPEDAPTAEVVIPHVHDFRETKLAPAATPPPAAPHAALLAPPEPRHPTATARQIIATILVAAALVAAAVVTIHHFSRPSDEADGVAEPSRSVDLNFVNTGSVTEVDVKPGDHVRAGQVLARQDPRVAQLAVDADNATLAADRAKLVLAQTAPPLLQQQLDLSVTLAQQQVATTLARVNDTMNVTTVAADTAQQRLTAATAAQAQAQARFNADCGSSPPPAGVAASLCSHLQDQLSRDANEVSLDTLSLQSAQDVLLRVRDIAQQSASLGQTQVALSKAKQALEADPASAAAQISSAQANIAADSARQAQDQQTLDNLTLLAPVAGVVSDVEAGPGDLVSSDGVHNFTGPPGMGRSQQRFNLFPAAPASGTQAGTNFAPAVHVYTDTGWRVVAEVNENDVVKLRTGQSVRVQVPALGGVWATGTVESVIGTPVTVNGVPVNAGVPARYDIWVRIDSPPRGLLPGMRARVRLHQRQQVRS
jgi:multidrug efflux pump subunit AcrA (membrane-fusion protein)